MSNPAGGFKGSHRKGILGLAVLAAAFMFLVPQILSAAEPIKIGASLSLTGKYAYTGERMHEGFRVWEALINEKGYSTGMEKYGHMEPGLIDGRPIKLIIYDDKSDPSTGVKLYQRLLTMDKVDLVLGPYSSAITKAISPIIEKAEMPMIASAAQDPGIWRGKKLNYIVQGIATTDAMFAPVGEIAAEHKAKTAAIIFEDTAFPIALAKSTRKALEEAGVKIVLFEPYPKGITDWTPPLQKAAALNPDIIGIGGYEPDAIGLTKAAQSIKAKAKMFVWTVATQAPYYAESVGDACYGMVGDLLWAPTLKTNGNEGFVQAITRVIGTPANKQVQHQAFGYTGCQLLEMAVKSAGSLDHKAIRDKLFSMEVETVQGTFKVAALGSEDAGIQVGLKGFMIQWQKKEGQQISPDTIVVGDYVRQIIWPQELKTADLIYPHPGWGQ